MMNYVEKKKKKTQFRVRIITIHIVSVSIISAEPFAFSNVRYLWVKSCAKYGLLVDTQHYMVVRNDLSLNSSPFLCALRK